MTGAELIAAERLRQVTEKGYTAEHDAEHDLEQLREAAVAYLHRRWHPWIRPFEPNPSTEVRVCELAKAGALIAAEIDRMQS